jgi:hypothetical protein
MHLVEKAHQAENLFAQDEIPNAELRPRPFVRVELHVPQCHGHRIEHWLGVPYLEILDAAVVDGLAQPDEGLARRR